jgi:CO/xanthine dehydrogenase Mo-binding subunit
VLRCGRDTLRLDRETLQAHFPCAIEAIACAIGGGFGARLVAYLDPVAAMLSRKSGRPVKMVMDCKEAFEGTGPTSATSMRCRIGATRDGRITAAQLSLVSEAGAFPGSLVGGGALTGLGPYTIDNLLVDGYDVVVNKQKVQAYRAPGQSQTIGVRMPGYPCPLGPS